MNVQLIELFLRFNINLETAPGTALWNAESWRALSKPTVVTVNDGTVHFKAYGPTSIISYSHEEEIEYVSFKAVFDRKLGNCYIFSKAR